MTLKSKIKKLGDLKKILSTLKKNGKKIIFTNGCFDILHYGHVHYLEDAKRLGDILVIALNSDISIKVIKGQNRPINKESDRAKVLGALSCVDFITIFNPVTPLAVIKILSPDVLVKGGDWRKSEIVGSDFVKNRGGKVKTIPYLKGYSTTNIIKKIMKNEG